MMELQEGGPVLVVAPHPDDEVLGAGGTIARLADAGNDVFVAIVTRGDPSIFSEEFVEQGRREAMEAQEFLGVRKTIFLEGFPAALVDTIPHARLNAVLGELLEQVDPELVLAPFPGDLHLDHRRIFDSLLVAARPDPSRRLKAFYVYETLSETNWNAPSITPSFAPNTFVDIGDFLELKLEAMGIYASQLKPFPNERSLEAIRSLAQMRGATVGFTAAEAFMLIRSSWPVPPKVGRP
jgi:LmbE family N-acetylglucosaminyl deacetylase